MATPTRLASRCAVLVLIAVLTLALASSVRAEPQISPVDSASLAHRVIELTNQERVNAGLAPLRWDNSLGAAARGHAEDMAARWYFSHYSPEGSSPYDRAWAAGYPGFEWGMFVGENLARGYDSPEAAVQGWMASEGHRNNILLPTYAETGIGVAARPDGRLVWVQEFGLRP